MLIYSENITPRLKYALKVIFNSVYKTEHRTTQNLEEFTAYNGPKINYSDEIQEGVLNITPVDLLFEKDIFEQDIHLTFWKELPIFFKTKRGSTIPFDLFAASFYLVARYEEYLPFLPDIHGRFTPKESLAYHKGFLKWPLVNMWCKAFEEVIFERHPNWQKGEQKFSFTTTIDVDNIFAYNGKGAFRTFGGIVKDITSSNFSNLKSRLLTLLGRKKDPFYTFDDQLQLHNKYGVDSIYFMLFAEFARFDRNISMHHPKMRSTVKHLGDYTEVAIHPSYQSNEKKSLLEYEKQTLENYLGKTITKSRQHFLKLSVPNTFRNLSNIGIEEEYSLGYARDVGFRASICNAHPFYDLDMEVETNLILKPFAFMDMCFINYKNFTPEEAWEEMKEIIDRVKEVNGELITVWHNRTFSEMEPEWKGWNKLYENMLKEVTQDSNS